MKYTKDSMVNNKTKKETLTATLSRVKRKEEERRTQVQAQKLGLQYINLSMTPIETELISILSKEKAKTGRVLIISRRGASLRLAADNPGSSKTQAVVKEFEKQGFKCRIYLSSRSSMNAGLKRYEQTIVPTSTERGTVNVSEQELKKFGENLQTIQELKKVIHDLSTTKLLTAVLSGAIKMKASDIHIEPEDKKIRLRYRMDGLLQDVADFPVKEYHFLLTRIKSLSGMFLNVTKTSQDGRFTINITDKDTAKSIDIRTSVLPSAYGESIVMRLLGLGETKTNLTELGIRPELLKILQSQIERPNGMILVTGPTGSGKTTTLYSCLNRINKPDKKIITVEDPIEYRLPGITQTQINSSKGQTFAKALKAIVRQDPDSLMVGEIRDKESADIALQFALTGHLVFSTLHTNDTAGAIPRLLDMGAKNISLTLALNLIIAQRLVRVLCPHCKEVYKPDKQTTEDIKKTLSSISPKSNVSISKIGQFYKPKGCSKCHGIGYKGRTGVYEFLKVSSAITKLITQNATAHELRAAAMSEGMLTLTQDAALKVIEGATSIEEVRRVVGSSQYEHSYGQRAAEKQTKIKTPANL